MAGSAAASRVAAIESGCVSGAKRNRPRQSRPPRPSARVSAQPSFRENLPVPVLAAMSYSLPRDVARISDSALACAARLYGE
jgi:hypothetical protein